MQASEWARRLAADGVDVVSCHPGLATSNVSLGNGYDFDRSEAAQRNGAKLPLHLATARELSSGAYYEGSRASRCQFSSDADACERLWVLCEHYG
eukprot:NODE_27884_length_497_cov_1.283784.p1 GENE.NODE_27884_length_497_cov_1.283784~~NODE_27884_length_497_cov_1.283784.p1  ORF type:complete len:95 (-),score=25.32 NODE_27884_length_497_cov_1.283784:213-497(-)